MDTARPLRLDGSQRRRALARRIARARHDARRILAGLLAPRKVR